MIGVVYTLAAYVRLEDLKTTSTRLGRQSLNIPAHRVKLKDTEREEIRA